MPWRLHADEFEAELADALDALELSSDVLLLHWSQPDAEEVMGESLRRGERVLALVGDAIEEGRALAAGATDAIRWPCEAVSLAIRAARIGRGPGGQTPPHPHSALPESYAEERTSAVFEMAADAVFVHRLDGSVIDVNPAACELLGYRREALLSRSMGELEVGQTSAELERLWSSLGRESLRRETAFWRADGTTVPVELSLARATLSSNWLVLSVARDVTERREAQERLQSLNEELESKVEQRTEELGAAAARLSAVLHHLADGVVAVDLERRVEHWNPPLETLLGKEVRRGQCLDVLVPHLGELVDTCLHTMSVQTGEIPLARGRVGDVTASPVFVGDGREMRRGVGAVLLVRDVTLARQVDKMKTEFTATVSHELRTPLTSVLGFAKLARTKLRSRVRPHLEEARALRTLDQIDKNLDIVAREGRRLAELIDDVLDVSKMEAGRFDWRAGEVLPSELVNEAVEVTSGLFDQAELVCRTEIGAGVPPLWGDRHRLLRVLINLISNAAKFTERGVVTIGVGAVEEGVRFWVRDEGPGVADAQKELVFGKFRQASDVVEDRPRGTGLGLTICKHIVDHHRGRIWVEDSASGGAEFIVLLPPPEERLASTLPMAAFLGHVERAIGAAHGTDVVLVESEAEVGAMIDAALTAAGYHCRVASDGASGRALVRVSPPKLLILDVLMSGLDPEALRGLIRRPGALEKAPITVLSTVPGASEGDPPTIHGYATQPLRSRELLETLEELAGAHELASGKTWVLIPLIDG